MDHVTHQVKEKGVKTKYRYGDVTVLQKPGLLYGIDINDQETVRYEYDGMARISKRRMNTTTPYTTTYRYLQGAKPGTTTTMVEQMQQGNQTIFYTYDNVGFIKTIVEEGVCKVSYLYDEMGQLIREDNNWINQTVTYHYDVGGNLLERNEYAYTTGLLGAILHQTGYQYEDTNWKDKLTKYKGQNMTYDAIGNPLTYRDNIQMTWENGRELSTLSQGALSMSFQYDCGGIRTRKIVDGVETRYYLKGSQIQTQITGEERLDFPYDEQEQLLGVQTGEETFYYVRNMQQDIIGILDREGTQVVSYTYDSWGKLIAVTGSKKDSIGQKNPFRYRGYYYDVETGLFYVGSRYYDPTTGRFLNADGVLDNRGLNTKNMFQYCGNNPVNNSDPSGYFFGSIASFFNSAVKKVASVLTKAKSVLSIKSTFTKLALASIVQVASGSATVDDVITDAKNYNFFNADESKVLNSNVFSSYNGTPVIRHRVPGITSFSVANTIVLNKDENVLNDGINTVKHEWGHNVQDTFMGTPKYLSRIALPSVVGCVINPSPQTYYSLPWERSADYFGGAERGGGILQFWFRCRSFRLLYYALMFTKQLWKERYINEKSVFSIDFIYIVYIHANRLS